MQINLNGAFALSPKPHFRGRIAGAAPSLRRISQWFGLTLPLPGHYRNVSIKGDATLEPMLMSIAPLSVTIDGNSLDGAASVRLDGPRPLIAATLAGSDVNLGPMFEDVPAPTAGGQWSHDEFLPSRLGAADLDLRLSASHARLGDFQAENVAVSAILKNGRLDLSLAEASAYSGEAHARAIVAESGDGLDVRGSAAAEKIDVAALLWDLFRRQSLSGTARANVSFETGGNSFYDLASKLDARGDVGVESGEIYGLDLGLAFRRMERQPLSAGVELRSGRTAFDLAVREVQHRSGPGRNRRRHGARRTRPCRFHAAGANPRPHPGPARHRHPAARHGGGGRQAVADRLQPDRRLGRCGVRAGRARTDPPLGRRGAAFAKGRAAELEVMSMFIRQFEYLDALAREKHFRRAAELCNVSQPTLSSALAQMEDELGVLLIERDPRFQGLTPEGELVLSRVRHVLVEIEMMRAEVAEARNGLSGKLRFGVIPTALPLAVHVTAPFCAICPAVTLEVLSLTSAEILERLANFELDAGMTYLDNEPLPGVIVKPIYAETYCLLTRADGPLGGRTSISWAEAAELKLCLLTGDMQNRRIIDGIFRSVGKTPKPAMETNSIFNLCTHAALARRQQHRLDPGAGAVRAAAGREGLASGRAGRAAHGGPGHRRPPPGAAAGAQADADRDAAADGRPGRGRRVVWPRNFRDLPPARRLCSNPVPFAAARENRRDACRDRLACRNRGRARGPARRPHFATRPARSGHLRPWLGIEPFQPPQHSCRTRAQRRRLRHLAVRSPHGRRGARPPQRLRHSVAWRAHGGSH